jgi:hypothetical protein
MDHVCLWHIGPGLLPNAWTYDDVEHVGREIHSCYIVAFVVTTSSPLSVITLRGCNAATTLLRQCPLIILVIHWGTLCFQWCEAMNVLPWGQWYHRCVRLVLSPMVTSSLCVTMSREACYAYLDASCLMYALGFTSPSIIYILIGNVYNYNQSRLSCLLSPLSVWSSL